MTPRTLLLLQSEVNGPNGPASQPWLERDWGRETWKMLTSLGRDRSQHWNPTRHWLKIVRIPISMVRDQPAVRVDDELVTLQDLQSAAYPIVPDQANYVLVALPASPVAFDLHTRKLKYDPVRFPVRIPGPGDLQTDNRLMVTVEGRGYQTNVIGTWDLWRPVSQQPWQPEDIAEHSILTLAPAAALAY